MEKQTVKRSHAHLLRRQRELRNQLIRGLKQPPPIIPSKASSNIIDEPIPEINIPILKPSHAPQKLYQVQPLKHFANKEVNSIKKELNKFADWILSNVPKPIKETANENVDSLKEKLNSLFLRDERLTPKEKEKALSGYLKTYRIDGDEGYEPKTFITYIKRKVLDLINQQKKPIKVKFIFTC